jgi:tetratricopeptide (TPR) repeat protein
VHCGYAEYILGLTSAGYLPAHEAMPLMRKEARKALEIDPSLPEANTILGVVSGTYDYDWKEAEQSFRSAMTHTPVPPSVRQWYGWFYLMPVGRLEEGIEQQEQGIKEDPLNIIAHAILAYSYIIIGRLADAEAAARRVLELEEDHVWGCIAIADACAGQSRWTEALRIMEKATPMIPEALGVFAGILKHMGEEDRADELIQKLMSGEPYGIPKAQVVFSYLSGNIDKAADWVEKMIEQHHLNASHLARWCVRSSPRWPTLAKRMNLPEK